MISAVRRQHLMVLPGGLAAGHLAASIASGHNPASDAGGWGSLVVQVLVCIGIPLAGGAGLAALRDGWRGHRSTASPGALVVQQVAAFVGLDLVEHALMGTAPWSTVQSGRFWITLAAHAVVGAVVWVMLRLAARVGRGLARRQRAHLVRGVAATAPPIRRPSVARIVALSSLSRRGPPVAGPAPRLI